MRQPAVPIYMLQYDQAIAFAAGLDSPELIAEVNKALVSLKESGQ